MEAIVEALPTEYCYVSTTASMIILKKDFWVEDSEAGGFATEFGERLNLNSDSCFIKLHDFLLVSVHLSSKKIRFEQAEVMRTLFKEVNLRHPSLNIIIGVDANQSICSMENLNVFPASGNIFTTRKRRTDMQLQLEKAGIIIQDVRDYVMTNLKISEAVVETVGCEDIGDELLPT